MSSHADTIRQWVRDVVVVDSATGPGEVIAALDALLAENQRLRDDHDALLDDTMTLMDQHASEEVQMEARRRIIAREALAGDAE